MGFFKEFKEFAVKGNVMDMAIGVIIGGAFGKIVSSLVNDIIMPLVGKAIGNVSFTDLFVNLSTDEKFATLKAAQEAGVSVFAWGQFVQNIIDFLIIALCIFLMVKAINKTKKKEEPAPEPAPAEPSEDIKLLTEIRDLLKKYDPIGFG